MVYPEDNSARIADLIQKKIDNQKLNRKEEKELDDWIVANPANADYVDQILNDSARKALFALMDRAGDRWIDILERVSMQSETSKRRVYRISWKYIAGAAAVLIFVIAVYLSSNRGTIKNFDTLISHSVPGNRAMLTSSDGVKYSLGNKDTVIRFSDGTYAKITPGKIEFPRTMDLSREIETIETPRGGEYQIVLPDGSLIKLNAQSSIRILSTANSAYRVVHLKGEGYFEIAKDPNRPFSVYVTNRNENEKTLLVKVLGTKFNINASQQKNIITTLFEGSIAIESDKKEKMLIKPNQQAIYDGKTEKIFVHSTDGSETTWKDGYFYFKSADIRQVMDEISLWYDLDVTFQSYDSTEKYYIKASRNTPVEQILNMLKEGGAELKIEGKHITIMKNH